MTNTEDKQSQYYLRDLLKIKTVFTEWDIIDAYEAGLRAGEHKARVADEKEKG